MGHVIAIASHRSPITDAANVVLPACTAYEQEGVYVSMAKRAQRLRPGSSGPPETAPAWGILIGLAHRLGSPPPYRTPARVFAALAADHAPFAGLSYDDLGVLGAVIDVSGDGGGEEPAEAAPAGDGLPLVVGGRMFADAASHRSDALAGVREGAGVALAPAEARRLGLTAGAVARLRSPHGECALPVRIDETCPEGAAFATLGVPGAGVERLLPADRGPVSVTLSREGG
jgi:predicted molibdopterin-dependent oxidoreductase YjgC